MRSIGITLIIISFFMQKMAYSDFFVEHHASFSDATIVPKVKKAPKKTIKNKVNKNIIKIYPKQNKRISFTNKKINFSKFREILLTHNFPSESIDRMWCIAHHESGFNPLAYNYNKNKTFDVGLFQINQIWKIWCRMKDKDLLDVSNNTRCALVVLKKQGYAAWVTYKKFCRGV